MLFVWFRVVWGLMCLVCLDCLGLCVIFCVVVFVVCVSVRSLICWFYVGVWCCFGFVGYFLLFVLVVCMVYFAFTFWFGYLVVYGLDCMFVDYFVA